MTSEKWRSVEKMMSEIFPKLPRGGLLAGASQESVESFEKASQLVIPDDLVQAYRIFNGTNQQTRLPMLPGQYAWLPLLLDNDSVLTAWEHQAEAAQRLSLDDDYVKAQADSEAAVLQDNAPFFQRHVDRTRIPVAVTNWGQLLFVDTCPPPCGRVGQVIEINGDYEAELVAPSFSALLWTLAEAYERGLIKFDGDKAGWLWTEGGAEVSLRELGELCNR